jgi:hypothetical protein
MLWQLALVVLQALPRVQKAQTVLLQHLIQHH